MANEKQRPKKQHGNVLGEDFYYRDNGVKSPTHEAIEKNKLLRIPKTKIIRGRVYAVKNDPEEIERASVQATEGGGVSVARRGKPSRFPEE